MTGTAQRIVSHTQTAPPQAKQRSTAVILGIGLALRLLVFWIVLAKYPRGWLFTRGQEMGLLAKSLVEGHGLSSPFGPPTGPTAFVAPGYPLLIAAVFRIFGVESVASAVVVLLAQIALNLLTVWLMMHIARKLAGNTAGILAGLIWAVSPPILWMPTIFWDTSIAICLLTGLVALALRLRGRTTPQHWLLLGVYIAVTALINPAMLLALIAIVVWLAFQQQSHPMRNLAVVALTFERVFAPGPIRNARVFHAFIPLRTTVGFELWMGNRPGATGFLDESLFPSFNPQELAAYKAEGELAYTAHKQQLATTWIAANPGAFAKLTAIRVLRYWRGTGAQNGSPLFALHATLTTLGGLIGLFLLLRRGLRAEALLFALPLLLFPMPYYITHAEFRYRLALDPLLTILTGCALAACFSTGPGHEPSA
jgi:hypothetical protein